jgi:hypothetical protein
MVEARTARRVDWGSARAGVKDQATPKLRMTDSSATGPVMYCIQ